MFISGRLCYGPQMKDRKGLTQNITLDANILTDWRISGRIKKNDLRFVSFGSVDYLNKNLKLSFLPT